MIIMPHCVHKMPVYSELDEEKQPIVCPRVYYTTCIINSTCCIVISTTNKFLRLSNFTYIQKLNAVSSSDLRSVVTQVIRPHILQASNESCLQ